MVVHHLAQLKKDGIAMEVLPFLQILAEKYVVTNTISVHSLVKMETQHQVMVAAQLVLLKMDGTATEDQAPLLIPASIFAITPSS